VRGWCSGQVFRSDRRVGSNGTIVQPSSKCMLTAHTRGTNSCCSVVNLVHGPVGLAATAATICVVNYAAAASKQQVVVALRLATSAPNYAARRQLSNLAIITRFVHL
jgi:hypothetical protein